MEKRNYFRPAVYILCVDSDVIATSGYSHAGQGRATGWIGRICRSSRQERHHGADGRIPYGWDIFRLLCRCRCTRTDVGPFLNGWLAIGNNGALMAALP